VWLVEGGSRLLHLPFAHFERRKINVYLFFFTHSWTSSVLEFTFQSISSKFWTEDVKLTLDMDSNAAAGNPFFLTQCAQSGVDSNDTSLRRE
jgi:hypothetical protein